MDLLSLLIFLIIVGTMFWAVRALSSAFGIPAPIVVVIPAFGIPAPIVVVIQVILVVICLVYLLQLLGGGGGLPTLRLGR